MDDSFADLIVILLDKNSYEEERLDAARYLSEFDDHEVLDVLIDVAKNPNEDDVLISHCGEAIGLIWERNKVFDIEIYKSLQKPAQSEIDSIPN